jgi:hypothetical protein
MVETTLSSQPVTTLDSDFGAELRAAVQSVRRSLADSMVAAGLDATIPLQVARALGIDKNLSWKMCRIVTDPDPALVATRLPGRSGVKIIMKALLKAGVPKELVEAVETSAESLRKVEVKHAGDRETLAAMLIGQSSSDSTEESQRRLSFLGNSATWGVKTRLQLSASFLAPSKTEGRIDAAVIGGLIGFQRLRNDLPWPVATGTMYGDDGRPRTVQGFRPIDPEGMAAHGSPFVVDFCSKPLPPMGLFRRADGSFQLLLSDGPVGKESACEVVTGWAYVGALGMYQTDEDKFGAHNTTLGTPAETLIHDLFIHRDMTFAMNPKALFYNLLPGAPQYPAAGLDAGLMRVSCAVEDLGPSPDLTTPEFARYPQLVGLVAGVMGWSIAEFVGYRVRLKYPPLPAMSVLRHNLAQRPG